MKKDLIKQYFLITIGILLLAIGLEYFYYPNEIAAGGISGLSLVIYELTGISAGIVMGLFNVVLFALAFWLIGGEFGAKSLYAAFGLTFILSFMEKFIPRFSVTDNLLLATVFGSIIAALGIAIVFNQGASTGGTAIVAKILNKFLHIDIGKSLLVADCVVIIAALFVFGVEKGLFGLMGVIITGTLIDKIIEGFNNCKQLLIISSKSDEIAKCIMKEIDRGCTKLKARGGYSNEEFEILYVVVKRKQFIELKNMIKKIDPQAFITVNEAKEVFGKGFADLVEK